MQYITKMTKKSNWEEIALDPNHPENEAARKFMDLVLSPEYRMLKDPDPRIRDWRLYLTGWRSFASSQVLGDLPDKDKAQYAQCELSRRVCEDLQEALKAVRKENRDLKKKLEKSPKALPVGVFTCISCKDSFETEDTVTLDKEFFPSTLDLEAGESTVRVTVALPRDHGELRKISKEPPPRICKRCFHALLNMAASRMIERFRMRHHLELWGPADGINPMR